MTKYYVDTNGNYLGGFDGVGAIPPVNSIEVPDPPEHAEFFTWNFGTSLWDEDVNRADTEADRSIAVIFEQDRIARLLFEINFDQENRIRVLEGKSIITKVVYRDALKTLLKTL